LFFADRDEVESKAVFGSTDGAFKKYLAKDYVGVNADGITNVDTEVTEITEITEMGKTTFETTRSRT
jgi:hypothetical protein